MRKRSKQLNEHLRTQYERLFGAMSSEEALQLAAEADHMAKLCGPYDFAYEKFASDASSLFAYADCLEQLEQA